MSTAAISFESVRMSYGHGRRRIHAVDDVSFEIQTGQTLAFVGESGCGKSTTARLAAGLVTPTQGRIRYQGKDIAAMDKREQAVFRRRVQIIHQDPYASLNPLRSIAQTLTAPLAQHGIVRSRRGRLRRAGELLASVGLTPPEDFLGKYPFELSGGQRQRVSIARALTVEPEFIVADEAVSMVDVSLRVALLNILLDLQQRLGVGFLMITHDLAVAKHFAWDGAIAVMYLGRIVELAPTAQLVTAPVHPYTQALLAALPEPDPVKARQEKRLMLRSLEVPSLLDLPAGCSFHPRCPLAEDSLCDRVVPSPDVFTDHEHAAACLVRARDGRP